MSTVVIEREEKSEGLRCCDCGKKVDHAKLVIRRSKQNPKGSLDTKCLMCYVNGTKGSGARSVSTPESPVISAIKIHSGGKPVAVTLGSDKTVPVKSWKEGYLVIVDHLLGKISGAPAKLAEAFPKYLSKDGSKFRAARPLSGCLFAETNLSAGSIQTLSRKYADALNQETTQFRFVMESTVDKKGV